MTLNARFNLKVRFAGFGFDRTHRCSQRGRGSGLDGLAPSMWAVTPCFSAVAELLVSCSYSQAVYDQLLAWYCRLSVCDEVHCG